MTNGGGWTSQLGINGRNTRFKLDTGAAVTVIGAQTPWLKDQELLKPKHTLCGPGNVQIPVVGMFNAKLATVRKISPNLYVIPGQPCPLLGRKVKLGLVTRTEKEINKVIQTPAYFKAEFPLLFRGLRKVKADVHIMLRPDAQAQIPYQLLPKVKQELDSMLQQGVISPVAVPSTWCSGLVPVPKPNGKVRLCA